TDAIVPIHGIEDEPELLERRSQHAALPRGGLEEDRGREGQARARRSGPLRLERGVESARDPAQPPLPPRPEARAWMHDEVRYPEGGAALELEPEREHGASPQRIVRGRQIDEVRRVRHRMAGHAAAVRRIPEGLDLARGERTRGPLARRLDEELEGRRLKA